MSAHHSSPDLAPDFEAAPAAEICPWVEECDKLGKWSGRRELEAPLDVILGRAPSHIAPGQSPVAVCTYAERPWPQSGVVWWAGSERTPQHYDSLTGTRATRAEAKIAAEAAARALGWDFGDGVPPLEPDPRFADAKAEAAAQGYDLIDRFDTWALRCAVCGSVRVEAPPDDMAAEVANIGPNVKEWEASTAQQRMLLGLRGPCMRRVGPGKFERCKP